jgi:antiviral helicase SKI2
LDTFQKEAVVHLERRECVFVAAHTSAGKTVVAEYAIALSKKHLTRTIYTSPIKALSNQKYRDFQKLFGDVGLITGDVQLNPEGSVLIMTTEILRSMLYRGADLIRDVEFLIFDECHYVSDRDRGVVWEEVIILVPSHVSLIFLSATVPNTFDFADWVGRVKRKKIHVISTMKRPTPLEHYLWAGKDLHKIVDSEGKFLRQAYESANDAIKKAQDKKGAKKQQTMRQKLDKSNKHQMSRSEKMGSEQSQTHSLVKYLKEKDLLPVVIFVYSKKQCENAGFGLQHMDLSVTAEKARIRSFFDSSVARLNSSDRKLPQIMRIKELLSRGIGVHHGGILPLVREIIEILFSKGLVKVLFATETFAMGLNMPARSVVFNSLRKHDGTGFRDLLPGEFLQAAGRAGRRGIDKVGTVIVACWHEVPDVSLIKGLVVGKAERLESQFRLTYNQILNLLRVEDFDPFDMMSRSFSESLSQKKVPEQRAVLAHAQAMLDGAPKKIDSCLYDTPEEIEVYHRAVSELRAAEQEILWQVLERHGTSLLQPGRVLVLKEGRVAVVLQPKQAENRFVKVFALAAPAEGKVDTAAGSTIEIDPRWDIAGIAATAKLDVDLAGIILEKRPAMTAAAKTLRECKVVLLDPVGDLRMNSIDFFTLTEQRDKARRAVEASACRECAKREEHFSLVDHRVRLQQTVTSLKAALSRDNLFLLPEFNARLRVLEKLEYIDSANVILIKGRVAREINSCDELIATEMIFEGVLSDLSPAEAIALLSLLVFEESSETKPNLTERLNASKEAIEKVARSLAKVQAAAGLDVNETEYLKTLKPGLMEVVYEWANGRSFGEIMTITEVQEGSIVRNIVRLEETCREFRSVARVIGDQKLYEKMEMASQQIKRDIVFTSSLYLTPTGEQEAPKEV